MAASSVSGLCDRLADVRFPFDPYRFAALRHRREGAIARHRSKDPRSASSPRKDRCCDRTLIVAKPRQNTDGGCALERRHRLDSRSVSSFIDTRGFGWRYGEAREATFDSVPISAKAEAPFAKRIESRPLVRRVCISKSFTISKVFRLILGVILLSCKPLFPFNNRREDLFLPDFGHI